MKKPKPGKALTPTRGATVILRVSSRSTQAMIDLLLSLGIEHRITEETLCVTTPRAAFAVMATVGAVSPSDIAPGITVVSASQFVAEIAEFGISRFPRGAPAAPCPPALENLLRGGSTAV